MTFNSGPFNSDLFNGAGSTPTIPSSPRRTSIFQPKPCDISRPGKTKTGSTVEAQYVVIMTGEPFDIQARTGAVLDAEGGYVATRRMVGYCDTAADIRVRDRVIDGVDTYEVTFVAVKGYRRQVDLERVSAP